MSARQLPLGGQAHNNQQLFSDYYLNVVLPQRADWHDLAARVGETMRAIAGIFAGYTASTIEAQTENDFVRPALAALGHDFEVQAALRTPDGTKTPDYVFYASVADRNANKNLTLTEELLKGRAYAVGDAKYWDRKLDVALKATGGDPFNNRNPSYQIAFYMQHSGLEWGILTNGRLWRLYHRDTAHKLDRFYEVDLPQLLASGEPELFLYFYAFFHRSAFEDQPLGVAAILRESTDYARGVSDKLKVQVFDALRHLAQGFLDYPQNDLRPEPDTLAAIYHNSLILLYRLLFILYAESRELLPVQESRDYRESYSLHAMTHRIARNFQIGNRLLPTTAMLWPQMKQLFDIIDRGSPPLKVATFNGGLFDPARHAFLERYVVGDAHLQQAIDTLARVNGEFVDYRDLAEYHLGSIYEGLLEYHLVAIPPEDGWIVDIENEKGERKRTGSYYTPNYIVKFIVEHTVGPLLEEAIEGQTDDAAKIDAILGINVLDPAMGSGYFLVEATEYIARFMVDQSLSAGADASGEPDLAYWKRRVVQSCVYGVDINPLAVDLAKLSLWLSTVAKDRPLSFLDHHLRVGNSVVGARIAELQSFNTSSTSTRRASRKAQKAAEAGQISMLEDDAFRRSISSAVGSMWLIEGTAGNTVEEVKQQERIYADLRAALTRRYDRLANLVTATHFGLNVDPDLWQPLADYATGRSIAALPRIEAWSAQAEALAEEHQFFHWELEFPEVFFDRYGQSLGEKGGFDAVVGNPPYVRQERLKAYKIYFEATYQSYYSVADLYVYFYERGLLLLREHGHQGYISSGTFARGNFAKPFRRFLPETAQIHSVINFGENQPFPGAEMVHPTIMILEKGDRAESFRYLFINGRIPKTLDVALETYGIHSDSEGLIESEWTFQPASVTRLAKKIFDAGSPLAGAIGTEPYRGILTGLNDAFIIDQRTHDQLVEASHSSSDLLKSVVGGEDLRPWYQEREGRWLIVIPSGWTRQEFGDDLTEMSAWNQFEARYPAIANHLRPYADAGRTRQDKGDFWWELRPCGYYSVFDAPKIIWPDIAKLPRFSLEDEARYTINTGYVMPNPPSWLLGVLQSRVLWFAISQICQPLRLRAGLWQYRLIRQYIDRLPIPSLSETDGAALGELSMTITRLARSRCGLDSRIRQRLVTDLGKPGDKLNQKLTAWWELTFPQFRAEVCKVFKHDIPLRDRDEWEAWLSERRAEHQALTQEIIRQEIKLNELVYGLFDLTPAEIKIIEESTKYAYGEV